MDFNSLVSTFRFDCSSLGIFFDSCRINDRDIQNTSLHLPMGYEHTNGHQQKKKIESKRHSIEIDEHFMLIPDMHASLCFAWRSVCSGTWETKKKLYANRKDQKQFTIFVLSNTNKNKTLITFSLIKKKKKKLYFIHMYLQKENSIAIGRNFADRNAREFY